MEVIRELPSLFDDLRTVPHLAGLAASSCGNGPLSKSSASQLQPKTVLKKTRKGEKTRKQSDRVAHSIAKIPSRQLTYSVPVYSIFDVYRLQSSWPILPARSKKPQAAELF